MVVTWILLFQKFQRPFIVPEQWLYFSVGIIILRKIQCQMLSILIHVIEVGKNNYGSHCPLQVDVKTLTTSTKLVALRNSLSLPPFLQHILTAISPKPLQLEENLGNWIPQSGQSSYKCVAEVLMNQLRVCISAKICFVMTTLTFHSCIKYWLCLALWKTNFTYHIYYDLALSKESVREGFLVDYRLFSNVLPS